MILSSFIISPQDSSKNIIDFYAKENLLKHSLDAFAYKWELFKILLKVATCCELELVDRVLMHYLLELIKFPCHLFMYWFYSLSM